MATNISIQYNKIIYVDLIIANKASKRFTFITQEQMEYIQLPGSIIPLLQL